MSSIIEEKAKPKESSNIELVNSLLSLFTDSAKCIIAMYKTKDTTPIGLRTKNSKDYH